MKNIFSSILAASFLLFFANSASALEEKSPTSKTQKELEDTDLKLSIEELRKKYPIGWLKERYGDSNHFSCGNSDGASEYDGPIPKNLMCSFVRTQNFSGQALLSEPKRMFLVKVSDFSESEIKSIFVREPDNYLKSPPMEEDPRMWELMGMVIEHLNKPKDLLTSREIVLRSFVYSDKILGPTKNSYLCETINKRFKTSFILTCSKPKK